MKMHLSSCIVGSTEYIQRHILSPIIFSTTILSKSLCFLLGSVSDVRCLSSPRNAINGVKGTGVVPLIQPAI